MQRLTHDGKSCLNVLCSKYFNVYVLNELAERGNKTLTGSPGPLRRIRGEGLTLTASDFSLVAGFACGPRGRKHECFMGTCLQHGPGMLQAQ